MFVIGFGRVLFSWEYLLRHPFKAMKEISEAKGPATKDQRQDHPQEDSMDDSWKRFADEAMKIIHKELTEVIGDGKNLTESDQRMVMCLNRVGHELNKLKFRGPSQ